MVTHWHTLAPMLISRNRSMFSCIRSVPAAIRLRRRVSSNQQMDSGFVLFGGRGFPPRTATCWLAGEALSLEGIATHPLEPFQASDLSHQIVHVAYHQIAQDPAQVHLAHSDIG
jgi:hypothetical protein